MIETKRLILRGWSDADITAHHELCTDPSFMRHLGPALPLSESVAAAARQTAHLAEYGSCFWAVELRRTGAFIGYCGVKSGPAGTPIAGLPEIGWGIAPALWGQGIAYEAAAASLAWTWSNTDRQEVHAITSTRNGPSEGLMIRLGMGRMTETFDHPALVEGDPLRRHVHYRIARPRDRSAHG